MRSTTAATVPVSERWGRPLINNLISPCVESGRDARFSSSDGELEYLLGNTRRSLADLDDIERLEHNILLQALFDRDQIDRDRLAVVLSARFETQDADVL